MTTLNTSTLNLEQVRAAWHGLTQHVPLGPILTESDYTQVFCRPCCGGSASSMLDILRH